MKIGFVPLIDCAPLAVAREFGFFAKHGVDVELCREAGWATIRDKIVYGELDAAHAVAGLVIAINSGLGTIRQSCVTGFLFNSHGDAITLSRELLEAGVTSGDKLADYLRGNGRVLTFGVVHPFSSHNFLMRDWFRRSGIMVGRDVRIVVVPPPLMTEMMEAGHVDGFCVGEPYNTVAMKNGSGGVVARSDELSQMHPEKALVVRESFVERERDTYLRLIAALQEACDFCDQPVNYENLACLLSRREYLHLKKRVILESFNGSLGAGGDFHLFSRYGVNRPSVEKANWLLTQIRLCGLMSAREIGSASVKPSEMFRTDHYDEAMELVGKIPGKDSGAVQRVKRARGVKAVPSRSERVTASL